MSRKPGDFDWSPALRAIADAVGDRPFTAPEVVPVVRPTMSATMAARWGESQRAAQRRFNQRLRQSDAEAAGKLLARSGDRWSRQTAQDAGIRTHLTWKLAERTRRGRGIVRVERGVYRITDPEEFVG